MPVKSETNYVISCILGGQVFIRSVVQLVGRATCKPVSCASEISAQNLRCGVSMGRPLPGCVHHILHIYVVIIGSSVRGARTSNTDVTSLSDTQTGYCNKTAGDDVIKSPL